MAKMCKKSVLGTLFLGCILLALTGCGPSASRLDTRDARDPLVQRARAKEKARDIDGAIEDYQEALARKPRLARAHLEVGLLYDKYREDYIRALYHYQRYIELRPQAEKRELIEELIRQARIAYAASLPDRPSGSVDMIADLRRENQRLRAQVAELSGRAPPAAAGVSASPPPPTDPTAPRPAPAQPPVETYVVQRGDTLSSIAAKMYNDPRKWRLIFEANHSALSSPENLRLGQTLIIPSP